VVFCLGALGGARADAQVSFRLYPAAGRGSGGRAFWKLLAGQRIHSTRETCVLHAAEVHRTHTAHGTPTDHAGRHRLPSDDPASFSARLSASSVMHMLGPRDPRLAHTRWQMKVQ
jgi:hypothetical protein